MITNQEYEVMFSQCSKIRVLLITSLNTAKKNNWSYGKEDWESSQPGVGLIFEEPSMFYQNSDRDLQTIYDQLKGRYELVLTNTAAVDERFSEDFPILVGKAHGQIIWL